MVIIGDLWFNKLDIEKIVLNEGDFAVSSPRFIKGIQAKRVGREEKSEGCYDYRNFPIGP
jgi:hypothetical protein